MDEAVDAFLDADEHAEFGDVLDSAFEDGALGVLLGHDIPRVRGDLLHAEGDALLVGIDAEHDDFDFFADLHHLGRMTELAGPGHLGDVNQTFDAVFQFHECAVVGEIGDGTGESGILGVLLSNVLPRIGNELLETKGDLLCFAVEGEDLQFQIVAELDHFLGMLDALPGHVSDVEETVEAAEIDEHAVFGDVLDLTGDDLAVFEGAEQLVALFAAHLFEKHAAGNDDVAAAAVDLEDLEVEFLIDQGVHVRDRAQINVGTGQECFHAAEIDGVTALDAADDAADDFAVFFLHFFQFIKSCIRLALSRDK